MNASLLALPSNKEIKLSHNKIKLGSGKSNHIIIKNPYIDKQQCVIEFIDNKYKLIDLNSKFGTFINGIKVENESILKNNDLITFNYDRPMFKFHINKHIYKLQRFDLDKIYEYFLMFRKRLILILGLILSIILFIVFVFNYQSNKNEITEKDIKIEYSKLLEKYGEKNSNQDEIIIIIEKYIEQYKNSKTFIDGYNNRKKYIKMVERIFIDNKIPVELSYIAFVESNFNPDAYNPHSGAKGMWQFMASTARQYGLKVNNKIDERTNLEKSTQAAAAYINDLISVFGEYSFTISIAAYNAGDGTLRQALKQIEDPINDRNFWYLYKNNLIPDETKEYVLKVISLIILTENYNHETDKE